MTQSPTLLELAAERVVFFDGAMGTQIQRRRPTLDDFGGLDGCNEVLVERRPDWIREIHAAYFEAGADVVETNSFGGSPWVLGEYGLEGRTRDLNRRAAEIAVEVARDLTRPGAPRFVSGSVGPGTRLPSLGHIGWNEMVRGYAEQVAGLLEGGVDVLQIETCQDPLQAKAAVVGAADAMRAVGRRVPVLVQFTVETTGTMLLGTEVLAALVALRPYEVVAGFGLNCATGPVEMEAHVRTLARNAARLVGALPNAGLPENVGGEAVYPMGPHDFARHLAQFVEHYGLNYVGGCCGTTPEHVRALVEAVGHRAPAERRIEPIGPAVASLYSAVELDQQPKPLLVGERTNANGSKKFREFLLASDWDGIVAMGRDQVREGAHLVDVCVAYVGRDERADIVEVIGRFATKVAAPLVVDSTDPNAIEEALQRIGGRAVVNSINFEDGGERLAQVAALCKRYGAAVVALTIDEDGMAKTAERKLAVAHRIVETCTRDFGLAPEDILVDPLTFTLGSGDEAFRRAGVETLEAIRRIKAELPGVFTLLGVSNVSFGLKPAARHVLNSVFLHHAVEAGLDAAIVHAGRIVPLYRIPDEQRELAERIVFDDRRPGSDPLTEFMALFEEAGSWNRTAKAARESLPLEERLVRRIVDGDASGLEADLNEALGRWSPLEIINRFLLEGMKEVGELFGAGKMQLPFVLQSAEVMKAAVKLLEPHMERKDGHARGTMVLATVAGDVHDIGKNLVDILLTNNGYRVINLGIKQPIGSILEAAADHDADAIGMSGLLVKSTVVMRDNLEEMNRRGITPPVVLGGAALTRRYVEVDLRRLYKGQVYYARDAFAGLRIMDELCDPMRPRVETAAYAGDGPAVPEGAVAGKLRGRIDDPTAWTDTRRSDVPPAPDVPQPPFFGARIEEDIDLDEVFSYLNVRALFLRQWQYRRRGMDRDAFEAHLRQHAWPVLERWKQRCIEERLLQPRVAYGWFHVFSEGNDVVVIGEDGEELGRWRFPRQRRGARLCLADYFRTRDDAEPDVLGVMAVTMGRRIGEYAAELYAADCYRDYFHLHGLGVEATEALAELWHRRMRRMWGIDANDGATVQEVLRGRYRGCRYSFGYPACPDLAGQHLVDRLVGLERIGVRLTQEDMLEPEQSTTALVVHHPQARYFNI